MTPLESFTIVIGIFTVVIGLIGTAAAIHQLGFEKAVKTAGMLVGICVVIVILVVILFALTRSGGKPPDPKDDVVKAAKEAKEAAEAEAEKKAYDECLARLAEEGKLKTFKEARDYLLANQDNRAIEGILQLSPQDVIVLLKSVVQKMPRSVEATCTWLIRAKTFQAKDFYCQWKDVYEFYMIRGKAHQLQGRAEMAKKDYDEAIKVLKQEEPRSPQPPVPALTRPKEELTKREDPKPTRLSEADKARLIKEVRDLLLADQEGKAKDGLLKLPPADVIQVLTEVLPKQPGSVERSVNLVEKAYTGRDLYEVLMLRGKSRQAQGRGDQARQDFLNAVKALQGS